ncbi:MAG TPA: hypothetical protein DEU95_04645 [Chloroflexi bacterium]|nr:hypothetical protein [Chloroflexota bacterium]HRA32073.1 TMEM175 family protein [Thermomicrobiales bacterium]
MSTGRLEAFSDGVLAIIITIMVLALKVPDGHDLAALRDTTGTALLSYILSFTYVGIYWNNHHHLFQATDRITGGVLWANLHLLFWLSLLPFTTEWMAESGFERTPVMIYGVNLMLAAIAYAVLQSGITRGEGSDSRLQRALGRDFKGTASRVLYILGLAAAALNPDGSRVGVGLAIGCFVLVAAMWLVPDRRLERVFD